MEQTQEGNEKSFVYDDQHGGDVVTCKPRIRRGIQFANFRDEMDRFYASNTTC